jgi:hypothetical protein
MNNTRQKFYNQLPGRENNWSEGTFAIQTNRDVVDVDTYEYRQREPESEDEEQEHQEQYQQQDFQIQEQERALATQPRAEEEQEYYFQYKKIHNTGYWGDVKRRRGTWLVALGVVSICMSIVMVSVFWRWWWGPEVNVPCRVVGITLLICGVFMIIGGLISNLLMFRDNDSKHFLGSPPRWSSWLLLVGLVSIVIAADFLTFYYSYWHNRFVNTPFISLGIILFFFGTVFVIVGLRHNFKEMQKRVTKMAKMQPKQPIYLN